MPVFSIVSSGDLFALNDIDAALPNSIYPENGVSELFRLDSLGNTIWKTALLFKDAPQGINLWPRPRGIKVDAAGNIYITGNFTFVHPGNNLGSPFLLKLDAQGIPQTWIKLNDMAFEKTVFTDDAIYLLDKRIHVWFAGIAHNPSSAIIAKFDYDFNLLWIKKYTAENFSYQDADIAASPSGGLYLSSATEGVYPVILSELDPDGNILSQKGYAHYNPRVVSLSDGSVAMSSVASVDNLGNLDLSPVVAKTDAQGNIAGCTTLPTCLEVSDTTVAFGTFHVEPHPVLDLEDFDQFIITPVSYVITPFCDYPPAPMPTFALPDTLCAGTTAATVSDNNRLAQAREWQLTGPGGLDSLLRDSFEFRYAFEQPGKYLLRQSVWVLGCRSDYERSVTVLPPLTVAVLADTLICPDEPQQIGAQANRPATYAWSSGPAGPILPVTASGTYAVTATDGHCTATDSTAITVVAGLLGGQPAFTLPPDTTICGRDLPYLLSPQSAFTDVFSFENGAVLAASHPLASAGTYRVGMAAFGCQFHRTYRLTVDCHADVYLPNSFSPNGDGLNDLFQPFGTDFEVLELTVYDRWGGLLHKGMAWDGGKAGQGVYVYRLVYRDLLSLKTVTVEGEVVR